MNLPVNILADYIVIKAGARCSKCGHGAASVNLDNQIPFSATVIYLCGHEKVVGPNA